MWSDQGQPSQGSIFPMSSSPPKTEGLPAPVNVDNCNNLMAVGEVVISSSSLSKLPLKRPYHYLESEPLDYNTEHFLDLKDLDGPIPEPDPRLAAPPPVQEAGLPEISNTKKLKKTKSEIDKDSREKKKREQLELENNLEKSKMEQVKLEMLLKESERKRAKKGEKVDRLKAQIAQLLAAIESATIDVAKMEKNMAQFKTYEDKREEAILRLFKLIEEDVSCKISKEDLYAQFFSPINDMETLEKYWEGSMKYKNELRAILETLLFLPK